MNKCQNHCSAKESFCPRCKLFFCPICAHCSHQEAKKIPKFIIAKYQILKILGNFCCFKATKANEKKCYALYVFESFDEARECDFVAFVNKVNLRNNENLIKIHDFHIDKEEKKLMIVTDFAEKNLKDFALSSNENTAMATFLKLCETIDFIHNELGMIHGGIKMKNILLKENELKVTNYWFDNGLQKKDKMFGPPEILQNPGKKYNESSDVWNLGVVFHKLLAKNANPFLNYNYEGHDPNEKIRLNILEGRIFISPYIKNSTFCKIIKGILIFF